MLEIPEQKKEKMVPLSAVAERQPDAPWEHKTVQDLVHSEDKVRLYTRTPPCKHRQVCAGASYTEEWVYIRPTSPSHSERAPPSKCAPVVSCAFPVIYTPPSCKTHTVQLGMALAVVA